MKRFYLLLCIGLLTSCDIFDKEEEIPSFIVIERADLQTNENQGEATENITDVTVFANNFFVGTFELPATVPILESGPTSISIAAGIKNNGLISDRRIYPFYDFYRKDISLIPSEKVAIEADSSITFEYFSEGLNYVIEDFESTGYELVEATSSNAELNQISSPPENVQNGFSLEVLLTPDSNHFEVRSDWELTNLPKGSPIYLEIDFKGTIPLEIGIITVDPVVQKIFALGLVPQEGYTKIYVDLTDEIARQISTTTFEIFLESRLPAGSSGGSLYIDNLKLIYP